MMTRIEALASLLVSCVHVESVRRIFSHASGAAVEHCGDCGATRSCRSPTSSWLDWEPAEIVSDLSDELEAWAAPGHELKPHCDAKS
jgi:hypothetical protein